jgi:nicotinamide mononucleotide (NMN) deamidase PncC
MARTTAIAAGAAAVVAIGVAALPATGHDVKPRGTLTFAAKAHKRDRKAVDVPPKGSRSATGSCRPALRQGGAIAGRLELDGVAVDASLRASRAR